MRAFDTASKQDIHIDHWKRPPWQQQVIEEQRELGNRLRKLKAFLASPTRPVTEEEKLHLRDQLFSMDAYNDILQLRIKDWAK